VSSNLDRYERIAPLYDLLDLPFEYSRYRKIRPMLFQGVGRRVLDAGVGTGRNIQFYPPGAEAVGVDLEFQDQSFDPLVKYVFFR
jgi:ubiquinone/menaquinone biosynthesis C-methylase UbiE